MSTCAANKAALPESGQDLLYLPVQSFGAVEYEVGLGGGGADKAQK